jgi:hypothetical protein
MTDSKRVQHFLALVRKFLSNRFILSPREKNKKTIQKLGLSMKSVEKIVLGLRVGNYSRGPLRDESGNRNDVWIFGVKYEEIDLYIKLSLIEVTAGIGVVCISFHEAEGKLDFPFGEQQ